MTQVSVPTPEPQKKRPASRGRFMDFAPKKNNLVDSVRPVAKKTVVKKTVVRAATPTTRVTATKVTATTKPAAARPQMRHGVSADFLAAQKRMEIKRARMAQLAAEEKARKEAEEAQLAAAQAVQSDEVTSIEEQPIVKVVKTATISVPEEPYEEPEEFVEEPVEDVSPLSDDELRSALAGFEMIDDETSEDEISLEDSFATQDEPVESESVESIEATSEDDDFGGLLDDFAEPNDTDLIDDAIDELESELENFVSQAEESQEDFVAEPEPFAVEQELSELLSDFAELDSAEPAPVEQLDSLSKKSTRPTRSPFLKSISVDKRPLSGTGEAEATPITSTSSVVAESISGDFDNLNKAKKDSNEKPAKEKKIKEKKAKNQPALVVSKADRGATATNGLLLLIAIILTIIFGAVVGAILYLAFFQ